MLWNAADFQPLPLSARELQPQDLPDGLLSTPVEALFPEARDANAALAGLLVLYGHWDLSHKIAQDLSSREGSYWHGIAHRIEPDSWNSNYWFQRVGEHPVFPALYNRAAELFASSAIGWKLKNSWDPYLFNDWCDEARSATKTEKSKLCSRIQSLECEYLFTYCALKTKDLA